MTRYARPGHAAADVITHAEWQAGARPDWLPPVHAPRTPHELEPGQSALAELSEDQGGGAGLWVGERSGLGLLQPGSRLVNDPQLGLLVIADDLFAAKWLPID